MQEKGGGQSLNGVRKLVSTPFFLPLHACGPMCNLVELQSHHISVETTRSRQSEGNRETSFSAFNKAEEPGRVDPAGVEN